MWGSAPRGTKPGQGGPPLSSAKFKENAEAQNLQNFNGILCNPWISSAMAMAMSIYRTLCVLVLKDENAQKRSNVF